MTTENNFEKTPDDSLVNEVIPSPVIEPKNDFPQLTIGQLLRQKREEKGLSLKFVSQQTKIHIGLLEYLEADQLHKLPSKTYIRGFVKSTTKLLGINQAEALLLLDRAYLQESSPSKDGSPSVEMRSQTARNTLSTMTPTPLEAVKSVTASSSLFLFKAGVFLLVVGIIGFNIKNFVEKSSEEDDVKLPEVLTTLHQKKVALPKPVEKKPEVPAAPAEPIEINLIQDKAQKATNVTVNNVNLQNISLGEKQFVENSTMTTDRINELLPGKYRLAPVKGLETIFLNASEGDSWLTYKVDDKEIKKFVLRQGRTLFLRGALIRLFIGNSKSLNVFYNNKPVSLANNSKSGKNIVLPEEMKTKYMAPLFVFQEDGSVVTSDEFMKNDEAKSKAEVPASPKKSP